MNKQAKIIITILSIIIVILLCIIIKQSNNSNSNSDTKPQANNEEVKKLIGIYHNSNWNDNEVTLELKDDMTCKYPQTTRACKWELKDNSVMLYLDAYKIVVDNKDDKNATYYKDPISTLELCEDTIKAYKNFNLVNPRCEETKEENEAKIINSGLLLGNKIFNKIG